MARILVIDDDAGVRESFRDALEADGYTVAVTDSGGAGIDSARLQKPDLVFLDLKMAGLSGVDTLKQLHAVCPGLPVYVVTAFYGDYVTALRTLKSNGIDFNLARKPLTVAEIQMIAASRIGQEKTKPSPALRHLQPTRAPR